MNDDKHIDFAALKYYDQRNKQYIDTKIDELKTEFNDTERRVDTLEVTSKGHDEQLKAHREELDDLEGRVINLERDDISIRKDIADLRVAVENCGGVSEDYVDNKIEEAIESLNIPDTSDFITKSEFVDYTEDFVTESQITELTDIIAGNQVAIEYLQENKADKKDIIGLATEEFVLKKIAEAELADQDVDLSAYYTKGETDAKIQEAVDTLEIPDVTGLATKEELEAVQNVAGSNSVKIMQLDSDLVDINQKLETIPSIEGLATETYVDEKFAEIVIPDISGLATKEELEDAINNIEHPTVDLSDYYTKAEVDEAIANVEHPTVDLEGYATENWVNEQGFLKEHQDLSEYAKKSEVPSIEGLATEDFVKSEIARAELNGGEVTEEELNNLLANYYNKSEVNALIPDVTGFATKTEVEAVESKIPTDYLTSIPEEYITKTELDAEGFIKEHQSLEGYATKEDLTTIENKIPSVEGLASETYVNEKVASIVIPDTSSFITMPDVEAKGYLTEHQDISHLATKIYVDEQIQNIDIPEVDLTPYATKEDVAAVESKIPDVSNFATKTELEDAINSIEHPTVDLEGYATEQWVKDELAKIDPSIPSEYITETELLEKNYITAAALTDYAKADSIPTKTSQLTNDSNFLTEHQDISGKADKSDLEGLATEQFVTDAISNIKHPDPDLSNYFTKDETTSAINEAIEGIEIPEVDLEPYATKAEVAEQLTTKADNIPFTADIFVTTAQGGFIDGDNLKGMTVKAILTKLLGLQSTPAPDEPDIPDEPTTIVDKIIQNRLGMYQVNEAAELIEIPYNYITYDNTSYDAAPDANYFYQKLDENGEVIESGYQHASDENDSMYYLIALPQGVNFNENVSVKVWDETSNTWADITDTFEMSSDLQFIEESLVDAELPMPTSPEGYTLWIDSSLNTCTGSDYRFIINE